MNRFQVQSRVKRPPDIIGRNRRAVRDVGRSRDRGQVKQQVQVKERRNRGTETVEISRSYLERLLQMTVASQPVAPSSTAAPVPPETNDITSVLHIQPDRSHIPGLRDNGYLTQQDMAARRQAEQRKKDREDKSTMAARRQQEREQEDYCPWGRPGGGAPIRTVSGALLTNYSTRGQAVQDMRSQAGSQWQQPSPPGKKNQPSYKPQFARGLGPHVDTFILSQREEQRRKELTHKEELAAQIAERQRQREAECLKREQEEKEAEERIRRELDIINRRHEREMEQRQRKAEEEKVWQATLQARIQEAEATALREKQQLALRRRETEVETTRGPLRLARRPAPPSRIPQPVTRKPLHKFNLTTKGTHCPNSELTPHNRRFQPLPPPVSAVARAMAGRQLPSPPVPAVARAMAGRQLPSPPVPAVARAMAGRQPPYTTANPPPHSLSPIVPAMTSPPCPPSHSPSQTLSPIVPALAKKLSLQAQLPSHCLPSSKSQPTSDNHLPTPSQPPSYPTLTHHSPTLPTLTPSQLTNTSSFPSQPPDSAARQQTILHQLAILREGIISQRKSLDSRLHCS